MPSNYILAATAALLSFFTPLVVSADLPRVGKAVVTVYWETKAETPDNEQQPKPSWFKVEPGTALLLREIQQQNSMPVQESKMFIPLASRGSRGSGFLLKGTRKVVTVLDREARAAATSLIVRDKNGTHKVNLVAWDPGSDVTVLELVTDKDDAVTGQGEGLEIADKEAVWGDALSTVYTQRESVPIVSKGIATTAPHYLSGPGAFVIETDISATPGSIGAPVLDSRENVVGIVKAIRSTDGTRGPAIVISNPIINRMLKFVKNGSKGALPKPLLGVALAPADPNGSTSGARVAKVIEDSTAEKAGIMPDDIITAVNGQDVVRFEDVIGIVSQFMPGDQLELEIVRDGEARERKMFLESRPAVSYQAGEQVELIKAQTDLRFDTLIMQNPQLAERLTAEQKKAVVEVLQNAQQTSAAPFTAAREMRVMAIPQDVNQKLDTLSKRIDRLTQVVEKLSESLK